MIKFIPTKGVSKTAGNLSSLLVNNFNKPILYRRNVDQLGGRDLNDNKVDFDIIKDNRPNPKQKNIDIKDKFQMQPLEIDSNDLEINEDSLKTGKNRIIAMPYQFNYTNFYKNKRSTKKKFTAKNKHLRDFGVLPHIFPESMFRDYYMQPIPLSKVQEGNIDI